MMCCLGVGVVTVLPSGAHLLSNCFRCDNFFMKIQRLLLA